jgi:chemotaxis protein CheZ
MSLSHKRYRIERTFGGAGEELIAAPPREDGRIAEILSTVQDLRRSLGPAQAMAGEAVEAHRKELAEVYRLKAELEAMQDAIASTRRELATLHRSEFQGKGMRRVAGELDAVVEATEAATTTILAAAEDIETQASMLRSAGVAIGNNDCVGAILERTVTLYEACNFQDLTGQRITKIVGVLKFVEERLDKVIAVWGGLEAFKELAAAEGGWGAAHVALLNGPKLDEDPGHVDQNEIDALFN